MPAGTENMGELPHRRLHTRQAVSAKAQTDNRVAFARPTGKALLLPATE